MTSASPAPHFVNSTGLGATPRERQLFTFSEKLLPEVASSPALVLGLADEIPPWVLNEALRVRVPFCLIPASPDSAEADTDRLDGDRLPVLWQGCPPARRDLRPNGFFDEVMAWDDPLEPFSPGRQGAGRSLLRRTCEGANIGFRSFHRGYSAFNGRWRRPSGQSVVRRHQFVPTGQPCPGCASDAGAAALGCSPRSAFALAPSSTGVAR